MLFRESGSLRPQHLHRTMIVNTHTPHTPLRLPLLPLNSELAPLLRISSLGEASMEQGNCLCCWVCYQGSLFSRLATAVLWETLLCAPLIVPLHQKQATAKEQSLFVFGKKSGSKNQEAVGMKMSEWRWEWGWDSSHRGAASVERSLTLTLTDRQVSDGEGKKERDSGGESPLHPGANELRSSAVALQRHRAQWLSSTQTLKLNGWTSNSGSATCHLHDS